MPASFQIDFEPIGKRVQAWSDQTLLSAAQSAGVGLASVCGGTGTCAECRIRLAAGQLTPPTPTEQTVFSKTELDAGYRLACQAKPLGNAKLDIPPESLTTPQRLQLEGQERSIIPHPAVNMPGAYGLAVDIGTTKLAAYLVRLSDGETVAKAGAMNPQVAYGEDVVSRIAYATRDPHGARKLQTVLVERLNRLLEEMCAEADLSADQVMDAVLVGNTAMHHLFAGLPVEQLGHAPFSPATNQPLHIPASEVGLNLAPVAQAYLPPVIAGYVGADHVAMLLAVGIVPFSNGEPRSNHVIASRRRSNLPITRRLLRRFAPRNDTGSEERQVNVGKPSHSSMFRGKAVLALDIGTNTEISLAADGKVTCCSCASGPAFEGAHIQAGMRAAPGAIERARWSEGKILWQTIGDRPPIGICGSGILDVVAALLDGKLVKASGVLQPELGSGWELVPAEESGTKRPIMVTRKDVNEIQLAKSAIRAGVETLLQEAGLAAADLDQFIVAGAFGTYLDLRSALRVGMFPPLPFERFRQVGNAAGVGAKQMLISLDKRRQAETIARQIGYTELTTQPAFTPLFMEHLSFKV